MRQLAVFLLLGVCITFVNAQTAPGTVIETKNTSMYLGNQKWKWEIFLTSDKKTINDIACVTYYLHKSFPDPVQKVCTKGYGPRNFVYGASGWGTFRIKVQIKFKNGKTKSLYHDLTFEEIPPAERLKLTVAHTKGSSIRGKVPWTLYLDAPPEILDKINCVQYQVDPTTITDVCEKGSPKAFALTGVSGSDFNVSLKIYLKDGTTQNEQYALKVSDDNLKKKN